MKVLLAITSVALLTDSLSRPPDGQAPLPAPQADTADVLQAYMNDVHMLAMDEQGQAALEMTARSLKQYSQRRLAELEQPQITLHDGDRQWRIVSQQGQVDGGRQTLSLQNQVVLRHSGSSQPLELRARSLAVDVDSQRAHTDDAVTLLSGETELHSQGMVLDNRQGRLQLLADVQGVIRVD